MQTADSVRNRSHSPVRLTGTEAWREREAIG
jgi:hypothetical protein